MTAFDLATPSDDAAIRALMRDNPMQSWVSWAAAREPSWFAGANRYGRDWAVIARQDGEVVGMYSCSEQPVHLNGAQCELGYLGSLRVRPAFRNRLRILREGYASVRAVSPPRQPECWYTAIASENFGARRLLEAGLRGMPRYWPCNDLVTLALPRSRGRHYALWRPVGPEELVAVCKFHNAQARQFQFSPILSPEIAVATGARFIATWRDNEPVACAALWNQQAYKQFVMHGYKRPLGTVRPAYNALARLLRRVELPSVGQRLDHSHLAFLAVCPRFGPDPFSLVGEALALSTTTVLTLALHGEHPWLGPLVRRYRPAQYRTGVYAVTFGLAPSLDGRPAQPEVAVM